ENPGEPADVVLMAVREHDGAHVLLVLNQVGDVGNHDVDAEQLGLRKHEPRVDHNNVVFPAQRQAIHAELAQPAQRNDLQFFCWHRSSLMLTPRARAWLRSEKITHMPRLGARSAPAALSPSNATRCHPCRTSHPAPDSMGPRRHSRNENRPFPGAGPCEASCESARRLRCESSRSRSWHWATPPSSRRRESRLSP